MHKPTYASFQVIFSQIQIHLSLSGFVTPELEPASISSLPAGTASGFVRLRIRQEHYKAMSAGRHFPSGCQSFSHVFTQLRDEHLVALPSTALPGQFQLQSQVRPCFLPLRLLPETSSKLLVFPGNSGPPMGQGQPVSFGKFLHLRQAGCAFLWQPRSFQRGLNHSLGGAGLFP